MAFPPRRWCWLKLDGKVFSEKGLPRKVDWYIMLTVESPTDK